MTVYRCPEEGVDTVDQERSTAAAPNTPTVPTTPVITGALESLARRLGLGEPHLARGPFARWPRATDAVLVVLVFLASLVSVTLSALEDTSDLSVATSVDHPVGSVLLLAGLAAPLWWRRANAVRVTVVILALLVVWAIAGEGDGQDLALAVATYSVGRYTIDRFHSTAVVAAAVAVSLGGTLIDSHQRIDLYPALLLTVVPWYLGRRVRNRGDYLALLEERARHLEEQQQARADRAVREERARIARELHDVVAHRVSMMTVQAGAARTIAPHDLDAAVEAMGDIEQAGRQALGELRHLLGVLRADGGGTGGDPADLGPQPGLADVPRLIDDLVATGADVAVTLIDPPDGLSAAVDLSAYRIVQESITNIIKHAGDRPRVEIDVAALGDRLAIDITNTGHGSGAVAPLLPGAGYGIAGMRERVAVLGGTLTAGAEPADRFGVHARLPLHPERA